MKISRANVFYPLLLAAALVLTFEDLLSATNVPAYRDLLPFVIPFKQFLAERLKSGEIPLWNPYISMGTPFLASLQTGVFYPPSVLLLLPFPLGFNLFLFAHFVIASMGFWFLSLDRGLSRPAAAIGSITFTLGGYLVSMLNVTNHLQAAVWTPWVLLFWKRSIESGHRRPLALFVFVLAAELLGGAPEIFLMTLFLLAIWTAFVPPLSYLARLKLEILLGVSVLFTLGVAAFQIVPTWEYIGQSARVGALPLDEVMNWSMEPVSLVQLLLPHSASAPALSDRLLLESAAPWIRSIYLGLVPACLVIAGLTMGRDRRVWGPMALVAILLALGPTTPLLPVLFQLIPGIIGKFRYPEKFYFFAHFAAAMLAARGAESLFLGERRAQRAVVATACVLVGFAGLLLLIRFAWPATYLGLLDHLKESSQPLTRQVPLALDLALKARRALFLLGAFIALVSLRRALLLSPRLFFALVVGLVLGDLVSINHGLNHPISWPALTAPAPVVDVAELRKTRLRVFDYETSSLPNQPPRPILGLRAMITLLVRDSLGDDSHVEWRALRMNIPMSEHIGTLSGIDGIYRSSDEVINGIASVVTRDRAVKLLRIFGTEYLIGQSSLEVPGLDRLSTFGDPPIYVYRAKDPAPAVYLASRVHPAASTAEAFNRMIKPDFVPGVDATVDELPPVWQEAAVGERSGEVRVTRWVDERIDLEVDTSKAALLVLNDSFFPGWEVRVDGWPAKIHRANDLVRGVFLAAGNHRVEFAYRPKSFVIGGSISLATLLIGIAIGALPRRRREPSVHESSSIDRVQAA